MDITFKTYYTSSFNSIQTNVHQMGFQAESNIQGDHDPGYTVDTNWPIVKGSEQTL